jgi:hypothetical protein
MLRKLLNKLLPFSVILLAYTTPAHAADKTYWDFIQLKCGATDPPTIPDCVETLVKYVITLAFPVAVIFIIISGFLFVTAGGSPEKLETAKKTLTWTIIGIAIAVAAWTLAIAFKAFFEGL